MLLLPLSPLRGFFYNGIIIDAGELFRPAVSCQSCSISRAFPCLQAPKHPYRIPETQTQTQLEISTRGSPYTSRCATMQVSRLPPSLNDASRWSFPLRREEVIARCSLAPQAVFAAGPTVGNKGLGTNHRPLDQLLAVNIRWRHQAVVKSDVHSREQILFNLPARPKARGTSPLQIIPVSTGCCPVEVHRIFS
jgi:hypothetical protein